MKTMKAQEAWYIDDGIPIEGILVRAFLSRPIFFPRSLACGFFSQSIFRKDFKENLFFSEDEARQAIKNNLMMSPMSSESHITIDSDDVNFGVDKIPAADVEPVRHGRWEFIEHFAPYQKCSQCSFELPMVASEQEIKIGFSPYCPNCGTRMDMKG